MTSANNTPTTRATGLLRREVEAMVGVAIDSCGNATLRVGYVDRYRNAASFVTIYARVAILLLADGITQMTRTTGGASMTNTELVQRLERLERGNRRWKLAAMALLLGCMVLLLAGFDYLQPNMVKACSVEAQTFVLRGADGQIRARLAIGDDGPRLNFYDEQGNVISSLPLKAEMRPAR